MPMCVGKHRFGTEHAAQVALVGAVIRRNGGSSTRRERKYYECPVCHGWHLTSQQSRPKENADG